MFLIGIKKDVWWLPKSVIGITLFPFIFLKKVNVYILNHENIHAKQQMELLVLPFYLLYILNYLINLFIYNFDTQEAYLNICFEREAYLNEHDLEYLKNRKWYSWIKYI